MKKILYRVCLIITTILMISAITLFFLMWEEPRLALPCIICSFAGVIFIVLMNILDNDVGE